MDPEAVIRRLRAENTLLRQELQLLRSGSAPGRSSRESAGGEEKAAEGGGGGRGVEQRQVLTEEEQHVLRRKVAAYVEDSSPEAVLSVEASMLFIRAAFDMLKGMVRVGGAGGSAQALMQRLGSSLSSRGSSAGAASEAVPIVELRGLQQLVQQQEQQIGVLTGVLRRQGLPLPGGQPAGSGPLAVHSRHSNSGSSDDSHPGSRAAGPPGEQAASQRSSNASVNSPITHSQAAQAGALQPLPLPQPAWPRNSTRVGGDLERAADAGPRPAVTQPQPSAPAYSDELLADQNKAVRAHEDPVVMCLLLPSLILPFRQPPTAARLGDKPRLSEPSRSDHHCPGVFAV